jgi:adenylate cyclase
MRKRFPLSTNKGSGTPAKRKTRATILLVALSFCVCEAAFLLLDDLLAPWNAQAIDRLFVLRSASERFLPAYDPVICHVDYSNATIQKLNDYYLGRAQFAQGIQNLASMRAAAQLYDFIFAAKTDKEGDNALIRATGKAGRAYFGVAFELARKGATVRKRPETPETTQYLDSTAWRVRVEGRPPDDFYRGVNPLITFPDLAHASRGLGFLSIKPDRDGAFRRVPLLVRWRDAYYPSIAFRVVCDYLHVPPENVVIESGERIRLKGARRPGKAAHDIVIPIDRHGNMVINFIGSWDRMTHYNFADVLKASENPDDMDIWRDELEDRIVVLSDVSTGASDVAAVPTDVDFPLSGLHANVMHTILTENFLRELSRPEMIAIEALLAAAVLLLSLTLPSLAFSLSVVGLGGLAAAGAAAGFLYAGLIANVVRPLILLATSALFVTAYRYISEEKERLVLRRTFEAYFPPSVLRKIVANPELITATGQKKELTILFSDIKSFTTYSAPLAPDQIQKSLNEYFDAMVEVVFRYEGTVDKYIGDGLMVFFGDPEPQPDHAVRCVRAAIDMQRKVRELKERWEKEGGIPIQIRIGINTGEVVVGNMGSARRLSYTVLGSPVNLAQRLESNAPVGGIMVSQRTWELVRDHVPTQSLGEIKVKGIDELMPVYEVLVDGEAEGEE